MPTILRADQDSLAPSIPSTLSLAGNKEHDQTVQIRRHMHLLNMEIPKKDHNHVIQFLQETT